MCNKKVPEDNYFVISSLKKTYSFKPFNYYGINIVNMGCKIEGNYYKIENFISDGDIIYIKGDLLKEKLEKEGFELTKINN